MRYLSKPGPVSPTSPWSRPPPPRKRPQPARSPKNSGKPSKTCQDLENAPSSSPLAQHRLEIDLDDGVKVNYLKFGDALAPSPGWRLKKTNAMSAKKKSTSKASPRKAPLKNTAAAAETALFERVVAILEQARSNVVRAVNSNQTGAGEFAQPPSLPTHQTASGKLPNTPRRDLSTVAVLADLLQATKSTGDAMPDDLVTNQKILNHFWI